MSVAAAYSAPGKAILLGEHAAVYGYPAIVAALGARMTVTVRPSSGGRVRLTMPALRYRGERAWEEISGAAREPSDLGWIAIAEAARGVGRPPEDGLEVRVDSAIPSGAGFGSSAALGVTMAAAIAAALGAAEDPAAIRSAAVSVERHQHGRPSGVDVEAVLRGGVLWCERTPGGELTSRPIEAKLPALASIRLFDSGAPRETTGEMVAEVRRRAEREQERVEAALEAIGAATRAGGEALRLGDVSALAGTIRDAEAALESLGIVSPGVRDEIRKIEDAGGAAKVSGAGGLTGAGAGLILVAHGDPEWHESFRTPSGWTRQDLALGVAGLRREALA